MSEETALVVVAVAALVVLGAVLIYVLIGIRNERSEWKEERRFLTDRAIARHTGEILALDKMDDRRENGAEPAREHVPTLPEGL